MSLNIKHIICFCIFLFSLFSCVEIEEFDNTPKGNFEALWKIMDEHYCFFETKNVNWDEVHDKYAPRITDNMDRDALFSVLDSMLHEVRDGHVNLITPFNLGRYWKWYEDYPRAFDPNAIETYLGFDYSISGGLKYKILDDNVGYVYYESFANNIGESNLDEVINKFSLCSGMIIDIRDNTGGSLSNVDILASRFTNERTLVGYIIHKTGKGHNDFSDPYPRYIEFSNRLRYQKPVYVLTNRRCYSATNDFVNTMRLFRQVTILGDKTGGGGGLPFSSELPNGWGVRFSASPILDVNKQSIEEGIDPDIFVEFSSDGKKDSFIEKARELIKKSAQ